MKTELKNGYWYVGTNKWNADIYTQEQAVKYANTLHNCTDCTDCKNCTNCTDCINCMDCAYCTHCTHCTDCTYCTHCTYCTDCINCTDCTDCTDCINCMDCMNCRNCTDCTDFKSNPQRIVSPKIGSRNSQSTYYFTDDHEQIVCGCFRGTLQEFEDRVKSVHVDNQHGQDYMKWIKAVKQYCHTIMEK